MNQRNPSDMIHTPVESKKDVLDTVKEKISDVTTGAADMACAAKDKAGELATAAKEKVKDAAASAGAMAVQGKDKVGEWAGEASDKVGDAVQEATQLIRRYPIQAMVAGLAVGFLLARATARD